MGAVCTKPKAAEVPAANKQPADTVQKAASGASLGAAKEPQAAADAARKSAEELKEALETNESETKDKISTEEPPAPSAAETKAPQEDILQLTEENKDLLAAARQQAAGAAAGSGPRGPLAYLFYASELQGGSLIQKWVSIPMTEEEMKTQHFILLATFVPARHKTVPKTKLQQNGGVTCFLDEIMYKWETWGKKQRQAYYTGWTKFLKAADSMEAMVTLHDFSGPAFPAKTYLLHTGPTKNTVLEMKTGEELEISLLGFAAVAPPSNNYKIGSNITPKRFGEIAVEAGGDYVQLSRRGGDAVFDEAEMVKWLAADGIEIPQGNQGITLSGAADTYERQAEKKGDAAT